MPFASVAGVSADTSNVFTVVQTFAANGIILAGAGAGVATMTYANSASNVTITFPAVTGVLASLAGTNVFTATNTFTSPKIVTSILDTNGNVIFGITPTASAVNYFQVANGAAGSPGVVTFTATGSSTDIDINLVPKGAGQVKANGTQVAAGNLNVTEVVNVKERVNISGYDVFATYAPATGTYLVFVYIRSITGFGSTNMYLTYANGAGAVTEYVSVVDSTSTAATQTPIILAGSGALVTGHNYTGMMMINAVTGTNITFNFYQVINAGYSVYSVVMLKIT